jgi:hypothetical protein
VHCIYVNQVPRLYAMHMLLLRFNVVKYDVFIMPYLIDGIPIHICIKLEISS